MYARDWLGAKDGCHNNIGAPGLEVALTDIGSGGLHRLSVSLGLKVGHRDDWGR
jgi:hypothetical protein